MGIFEDLSANTAATAPAGGNADFEYSVGQGGEFEVDDDVRCVDGCDIEAHDDSYTDSFENVNGDYSEFSIEDEEDTDGDGHGSTDVSGGFSTFQAMQQKHNAIATNSASDNGKAVPPHQDLPTIEEEDEFSCFEPEEEITTMTAAAAAASIANFGDQSTKPSHTGAPIDAKMNVGFTERGHRTSESVDLQDGTAEAPGGPLGFDVDQAIKKNPGEDARIDSTETNLTALGNSERVGPGIPVRNDVPEAQSKTATLQYNPATPATVVAQPTTVASSNTGSKNAPTLTATPGVPNTGRAVLAAAKAGPEKHKQDALTRPSLGQVLNRVPTPVPQGDPVTNEALAVPNDSGTKNSALSSTPNDKTLTQKAQPLRPSVQVQQPSMTGLSNAPSKRNFTLDAGLKPLPVAKATKLQFNFSSLGKDSSRVLPNPNDSRVARTMTMPNPAAQHQQRQHTQKLQLQRQQMHQSKQPKNLRETHQQLQPRQGNQEQQIQPQQLQQRKQVQQMQFQQPKQWNRLQLMQQGNNGGEPQQQVRQQLQQQQPQQQQQQQPCLQRNPGQHMKQPPRNNVGQMKQQLSLQQKNRQLMQQLYPGQQQQQQQQRTNPHQAGQRRNLQATMTSRVTPDADNEAATTPRPGRKVQIDTGLNSTKTIPYGPEHQTNDTVTPVSTSAAVTPNSKASNASHDSLQRSSDEGTPVTANTTARAAAVTPGDGLQDIKQGPDKSSGGLQLMEEDPCSRESFESFYATFQNNCRSWDDLQEENEIALLAIEVLYATAYSETLQNQEELEELLETIQMGNVFADDLIAEYREHLSNP